MIMKLSLAITTYNRFELTVKSFCKVMDDPRIDDILILDDCSTDGSYEKLANHFYGYDKVRVIKQIRNRGMSMNKADAIALSKSQWVLIFDSDNDLSTEYLDAFDTCEGILADPSIIWMPDYALPGFDYTKFGGRFIDKKNVKEVVKDPMGNCAFNTANYIVNRDYYSQTYKYNPEHLASDTIWHNYNHLLYGGSFYVVPKMRYGHLQHPGSGFLQDLVLNMANAEKVRKLIMTL